MLYTLELFCNPAKTSQGIPRPLGIFLRPPHLVPKSYDHPKLNQMKEPHYTMAIQKWKGKAKTIVTIGKTHANESERTKYTHACTMHAKTSKEIIHATRYL